MVRINYGLNYEAEAERIVQRAICEASKVQIPTGVIAEKLAAHGLALLCGESPAKVRRYMHEEMSKLSKS